MASLLETSIRAGVTDAFRDLLCALNPYLDAALPQSPRFHRFCDLPAELRFNIYGHYFRSERGALLTRSWPIIPQISVFVIEPRLNRKSQILPNVCFVDRATGKEAISCLISVATLTLHWSTDIADISKLAAACHLNGIRIRDHIHIVSLTQINGCYLRWIYEGTMNHELDRARNASVKASTLLKNSCFDNLHQLSLTFHAPDCFEHIHDNSDDEEETR
jgi:hypothetical protein